MGGLVYHSSLSTEGSPWRRNPVNPSTSSHTRSVSSSLADFRSATKALPVLRSGSARGISHEIALPVDVTINDHLRSVAPNQTDQVTPRFRRFGL